MPALSRVQQCASVFLHTALHLSVPTVCVWPGILSDCRQGNITPCKIPTTYIWGGGEAQGLANQQQPVYTGLQWNQKIPTRTDESHVVSLPQGVFHPTLNIWIPWIHFNIKICLVCCCRRPLFPPKPPAKPCLIVRSLHNSNILSLITQHTTNIGSLTIPPSFIFSRSLRTSSGNPIPFQIPHSEPFLSSGSFLNLYTSSHPPENCPT